jgi:hypothetical protein
MGGLAWWRHWVLRLLLWCSGALPLRLVPWLDEAAQRILLRKVGGGYRFIHDLFRDYLATLDPSELSGSVAQAAPCQRGSASACTATSNGASMPPSVTLLYSLSSGESRAFGQPSS